jgi:hypothetical protein
MRSDAKGAAIAQVSGRAASTAMAPAVNVRRENFVKPMLAPDEMARVPVFLIKMAVRRPPCLAGQYSREKVVELRRLSRPFATDDLRRGFA